jgi:hypothetical protein
MTFTDLRAEFERVGIGTLLYAHLRELVTSLASRYPPSVYAELPGPRGNWTPELLEDLLQSFVTDVLLDGGQLQYAMDVAHDSASFDALLRKQLKRHLRQRRRHTVVDNLIERCREILATRPFSRSDQHPNRFTLERYEVADPPSEEGAIREAAKLVARIPRVRVSGAQRVYGAERAPTVFSTENLGIALVMVVRTLGCPISLEDVRHVLDLALTDLIPRDLLPNQEPSPQPADMPITQQIIDEPGNLMAQPPLSADDLMLVNEAVNSVLQEIAESEERAVLLGKLVGDADEEIARRLGRSRPTVIQRKKRVFSVLEQQLEQLPDRCQHEAIDGIFLGLLGVNS